jgi:hypothetical protein
MKQRGCFYLVVTILALSLSAMAPVAIARPASESATSATILVYHRFGPVVADSMTVTTAVFASQLKYLHDNGYSIVPLHDLVNFAAGHGELPPRAVAITADDGHRTVFSDMKPLVERYRIPVTLFIYPSAISNARHRADCGAASSTTSLRCPFPPSNAATYTTLRTRDTRNFPVPARRAPAAAVSRSDTLWRLSAGVSPRH